MGLKDILTKGKIGKNTEEGNVTGDKLKNKTDMGSSINFIYKGSGIEAKISFSDIEQYHIKRNGEVKDLQKLYITYTKPDGFFEGRKVYTDPMYVIDKNGNKVYNTKQYYLNLMKGMTVDGKSMATIVKGLFDYDSIKNLKTDYIGHIGKNEEGHYTREFDHDYGFVEDYIQHFYRIKLAEAKERAEEAEIAAINRSRQIKDAMKNNGIKIDVFNDDNKNKNENKNKNKNENKNEN